MGRIRRTIHYYADGLYHRIAEHHSLLLASGLAFSLIVCIIPLILILFSALGIILEQTSVLNQVERFIDNAIPYQEYASKVKEVVLDRLDDFSEYKHHAGLIGLFGLLFAASGLFSSMRTVLNRIFHFKRTQSLLVGKLHDIGLIITVLIFVLLYMLILPGVEVAKEILPNFDWQSGYSMLLSVASFILLTAGFFLVYFSVPQKRLPIRVVLISSLSAGILWQIAKQLFGYYLGHAVTLTHVYGTYTLLIVLAFWIYYTALVFVIGAEIGQLFRERPSHLLSQSSSFFID